MKNEKKRKNRASWQRTNYVRDASQKNHTKPESSERGKKVSVSYEGREQVGKKFKVKEANDFSSTDCNSAIGPIHLQEDRPIKCSERTRNAWFGGSRFAGNEKNAPP